VRLQGERLQLIIDCIEARVPFHQYVADLHPRDLDSPQMPGRRQRILYDCLHDYLAIPVDYNAHPMAEVMPPLFMAKGSHGIEVHGTTRREIRRDCCR
jgi:hypothetical protein